MLCWIFLTSQLSIQIGVNQWKLGNVATEASLELESRVWVLVPTFIFVVAELGLTLCDPIDCSKAGSSVLHYLWSLLKFMSVDSLLLSKHLILCSLLLLLPSVFPSIRVFFNESALCIRCPKFWSFSFTISPSNEYSGLFLLRWLVWSSCCPRDFQESSPAPQFKNISSLVLSLLYGPTFMFVHAYWKNHSFGYMDLCWQSDVSAF